MNLIEKSFVTAFVVTAAAAIAHTAGVSFHHFIDPVIAALQAIGK